jgi:hypothetical protein
MPRDPIPVVIVQASETQFYLALAADHSRPAMARWFATVEAAEAYVEKTDFLVLAQPADDAE